MSELGEKRELFTRNIYLLLGKMYEKGYRPRFDIEHCTHMEGSLHYKGLAKDILLFDKNNIYLQKTEDHKEFGEYWESLGGSWGGRFSDGNHYSIAFGGKK
jgi:hypothetical protein